MPGLFQTDSQDEDVRNPPTKFQAGIGHNGPSMRQMNPKLLLELLKGKLQQRHAQQQAQAKAMQAQQQQAQSAQIMQTLSPREQIDAMQGGIKYALSQRAAREAGMRSDDRQQAGFDHTDQAASDARAAKKYDLKRQAEAILSHPNMQPGVGDSTLQPPPEGFIPDDSSNVGQGVSMQPPPDVRVMDPNEEAIILGADAQLPPGYVKRKDYEDKMQAWQKQKGQTKKDADKLAKEEEAKKSVTEFLSNGGTEDEVAKAQVLMPALGPKAAFAWVERSRTKKRAEEAAAAKTKRREETNAATQAEKDAISKNKLQGEINATKEVKVKGAMVKQEDGSYKQTSDSTKTVPKFSEGERKYKQAELDRINNRGNQDSQKPKTDIKKFGWRDDSTPESMDARAEELQNKQNRTPEEQEELDALDGHLAAGFG